MFETSSAVLPAPKEKRPLSINKTKEEEALDQPVGQVNIEKEPDPQRQKLLDYLIATDVLYPRDGFFVFDRDKFDDPAYIAKQLSKLRVGQINGKRIFGSKKLIYEKLEDLDIITIGDYQKSTEAGEEIKLKKLFNIKEKDQAKEKLLNILREHGILQNIDGYNVFDLKKFLYSDFMNSKLLNTFAETKDKKARTFNQKLIFEKLSDLKVISKEDFELRENKEPQEKKTF